MALVSTEKAFELGAGKFGDPDAPAFDLAISSFNPNVLAVRDDRLPVVAEEAGARIVAATVPEGPEVALA